MNLRSKFNHRTKNSNDTALLLPLHQLMFSNTEPRNSAMREWLYCKLHKAFMLSTKTVLWALCYGLVIPTRCFYTWSYLFLAYTLSWMHFESPHPHAMGCIVFVLVGSWNMSQSIREFPLHAWVNSAISRSF